jgi:hypothetical protein
MGCQASKEDNLCLDKDKMPWDSTASGNKAISVSAMNSDLKDRLLSPKKTRKHI